MTKRRKIFIALALFECTVDLIAIIDTLRRWRAADRIAEQRYATAIEPQLGQVRWLGDPPCRASSPLTRSPAVGTVGFYCTGRLGHSGRHYWSNTDVDGGNGRIAAIWGDDGKPVWDMSEIIRQSEIRTAGPS